jgi:hypothetical protein
LPVWTGLRRSWSTRPAASDSDVQRYWNQQKHSDNAYRIKENWVA